MIGRFFVVGMFMMINLGLAVGMMFAALFLLRPLLVRILSPGQRVALWVVGWISLYSPSFYGLLSLVHILPVTFRDLITVRVKDGGWTTSIPAYLPMDYHGAGVYHLSLPGGAVVPVEIGEGIAGAAALLCLGVLVLGIVFSCRQDRRLKELLHRGELLGGEEALTKHVLQEETRKIQIRLVEGLPTSFLTSRGWLGSVEYVICLQRELSPEQRALVLRHELEHIRLGHLWFKGWANMGVFLYWWDPLIWLGYKYFCRDLELACDAAVLKELEPEERREYARTLVEMGAGRSLWSTPLCFGECDTAVRVKTAARPQRTGGAWRGLSWLTTVLLFLFFLGGPTQGVLAEDALLTWERGGGTVDTLVAHTMDQVRQDLGLGPILALQVWCVAEDGEHVWVVMELLEQGWVGAEYFWYPARDRLYFTHAEVLKKPPDLTGAVPLS